MASHLIYFLEANVVLAVLLAVYFIIRNQLSFRHRRVTLLLIPVLSLLVFLIKYNGLFFMNPVYHIPAYELDVITVSDTNEKTPFVNSIPYSSIYFLGVSVLLMTLFARVTWIFYRFRKTKRTQHEGLRIMAMKGENCFSFFNCVQLNADLTEEERSIILEHERIHVRQKHSYDILLLELIHAFTWFNPAMLVLKRELIQVHEYQVDQLMYSKYQTHYMEFLLAYSIGTSSNQLILTNQFYTKKTLIKRLKIMKNKTKNKWVYALTLPLMAGSFSLISWTFTDRHYPTPGTSVAQEKIQGEIDKAPEFKGGQEAMMKYFSEQIKYPAEAKENKIEGTVYVGFVVLNTGKIADVKLKRGVSSLLDDEAIRVVANMPDWLPGEKNGKTVNAEMTLPINFKL